MTSASEKASSPAIAADNPPAGCDPTGAIRTPRSMAAVLTLTSTPRFAESCALLSNGTEPETPVDEGDRRGGDILGSCAMRLGEGEPGECETGQFPPIAYHGWSPAGTIGQSGVGPQSPTSDFCIP